MTEIAIHDAPAGTLALRGDQIEWTPVQRAALAHIGIADAPLADQQVFMHVCQRTGLDPFARQIYMIARTEGRGRDAKTKWTIQTGIDGFRAKAAERPEYRGQIGPQWCGDDGVWHDVWVSSRPPVAARVGILRDDMRELFWGIAMYREYVQTKTWDNVTQPTKMWREKPAHMTAKCAEALGLRRAFPDQLSGLYTDDEMGHLDNPRDGRRTRTVIDQDPVTAAELTGAAPAPALDWDGEIGYAVHLADIDALRDLYRQAEGHPEVRDRITAAVQELRNRPAPNPDDVVAAEIVELDPRDADRTDADRTDEYVQAMADEDAS